MLRSRMRRRQITTTKVPVLMMIPTVTFLDEIVVVGDDFDTKEIGVF